MRRADRPLKDHVAKLIELSQREDAASRKAATDALERLARQMRDDPVPAYIPSLIVMLQHRASASRAALALGHLAETAPTSNLGEALAPLQEHLWRSGVPLIFLTVRRQIERALCGSLPIPAAAPELSVADLPIPMQEDGGL
jgi:hypothetical protein